MGLFRKEKLNDVLFLQPVRQTGEKLPRSRVRMLYCTVDGEIFSAVMNRSVYDQARRNAADRARHNRPFATVGLETAPGKYTPTTVNIGRDDVWALDRILEHALSAGRLPDILKKYVKPIILRGSTSRETILAAGKRRRAPISGKVVPKVLDRLPYYPDEDIEVSMPIYKATYRYPLVVLKRLQPDEQTQPGNQRLLILDSDGDMAVIKVPTRLIRTMELELIEEERKNHRPTRALITRNGQEYEVDYLPLSREQNKSLTTLTTYYEQTGNNKQRMSMAVKSVLARAKDAQTTE